MSSPPPKAPTAYLPFSVHLFRKRPQHPRHRAQILRQTLNNRARTIEQISQRITFAVNPLPWSKSLVVTLRAGRMNSMHNLVCLASQRSVEGAADALGVGRVEHSLP